MNQEKNKTTVKTQKSYKSAFWGTIALTLVLIVVAISLFTKNEYRSLQLSDATAQNDTLTDSLAHYGTVINELVATLNEIESDLNTMRSKEKQLEVQSYDPEMTKSRREEIVADIKHLNTLLAENKKKVRYLNKRLKSSGLKIAALEEKISMMETTVARRDSSINELKLMLVDNDFAMAELNTAIDSLTVTVIQQTAVLSEKEKELNTAYVISGNEDELESKGVLVKEGGFLGLGKSKVIPSNLSDADFTQVDISQVDKIAINAKKTHIISEHPSDSYEIIQNDSLIAYIEIKNPKEFWRITRYAVVETE